MENKTPSKYLAIYADQLITNLEQLKEAYQLANKSFNAYMEAGGEFDGRDEFEFGTEYKELKQVNHLIDLLKLPEYR